MQAVMTRARCCVRVRRRQVPGPVRTEMVCFADYGQEKNIVRGR
jgi:hypothetical protein